MDTGTHLRIEPRINNVVARHLSEVAYQTATAPTHRVASMAELLADVHRRGGSIFIFGNGGSAATASHLACDLAKGDASSGAFVRAIALTDAVPLLTACANDLGYEEVFARALSIYARAGDVAVAISGSGNSPNVLSGVRRAREMGLHTLAFTGFGGGRLAGLVDQAITIRASSIQVVEDVHAALCHALACTVHQALEVSPIANGVTRRPAIFCDRDGVLNARRPDDVKSWHEFEFLPGVLEAMQRLASVPVPVVVVTNQPSIGRGLVSSDAIAHIHEQMQAMIRRFGGPELSIYTCPHVPEESCNCRKPRPGLLRQAALDLHLDLEASVLIGDRPSDALAGLSVGAKAVMVGPAAATEAMPAGVLRAPDFAAAVDLILAQANFGASLRLRLQLQQSPVPAGEEVAVCAR